MTRTLLLSRQPLSKRPLQDWLDDTAGSVVLLTTHKAVAESADVLMKHFPMHHLVERYGTWETEFVAERVGRELGVELVASTSEHDVLRAARLRERLGLPGQHSDSALAFRDKYRMKRVAEAAGIAVPPFAQVNSPKDLLDFVAAHGYPVVVKPRFGAGASGVSILQQDADVTAFLAAETGAEPPYLPGQWMVETFVHGDFFHVDGIMSDGGIVHGWPSQYNGGLAEQVRDEGCVSSAQLAPADDRRALLMDLTSRVIGALPGSAIPLAFHLEAWLDGSGRPVLCEIASRAGGGRIAETYERTFGIQLAREGLRAQCGAPLSLSSQPAAPSAQSGWVLFPLRHGVFVPPIGTCPVPSVEVSLHLAVGATSEGMALAGDMAADALVFGDTAAEVSERLGAVTQWWLANVGWK